MVQARAALITPYPFPLHQGRWNRMRRLVMTSVPNAHSALPPQQNSRYWPLDGGKFTGTPLTTQQQEAVKQLWSALKADLEKEAEGAVQQGAPVSEGGL